MAIPDVIADPSVSKDTMEKNANLHVPARRTQRGRAITLTGRAAVFLAMLVITARKGVRRERLALIVRNHAARVIETIPKARCAIPSMERVCADLDIKMETATRCVLRETTGSTAPRSVRVTDLILRTVHEMKESANASQAI